jgi:hypothetical protein
MKNNYWESINKREYFYWTGICSADRLHGMSQVEKCILNFGFIVDYKFFSDLSMSVIIEIEERKMEALYEELAKVISLSDFDKFNPDSEKECTVLFNITFTRGTGDLQNEIPAVPG